MTTKTQITRSLDDAMLGGVLSGISARYGWDPTLVRIVAALVTIATGVIPGVLLYLAAWVIIPPSGTAASAPRPAPEDGAPTPAAPASGAGSTAAPPSGVADEISEALRDAADRIGEAAAIAADAARRAANEIGEVARRPRATTVVEPPAPGATQPAEATRTTEVPAPTAPPADPGETPEPPDQPEASATAEEDRPGGPA
jgi:phage shock protein PspC (stress-responsive transcriptional regulator)